MIVGYHIIFGTYGFWLPNDPRGSWSTFVGSWDLFRYGPATKTTERRSVAYHDHDRQLRQNAKSALKYPPVRFTGLQARAVATGFGHYATRRHIPVWACAVMPDHVHLVLGRCGMKAEQLAIQFKGQATRQLEQEGLHPPAERCWAQGQWKVFLDEDDVQRAIRYVRDNPVKEGLKRQEWKFVTLYCAG